MRFAKRGLAILGIGAAFMFTALCWAVGTYIMSALFGLMIGDMDPHRRAAAIIQANATYPYFLFSQGILSIALALGFLTAAKAIWRLATRRTD